MFCDVRLNLVITGHVDHGKSTLIGRLLFETGCLQDGLIKEIKASLKGTGMKMEFAHIMDYFEEERIQERTIDTTQFFFNTKKRRYVIIDTPGHKEFIKNMITGSSQAQAAILIISAKEGIEEQTKRHAYILKMLGIKNIILAINKMDLVGYSQDKFREISLSAKDIIALLDIREENIIPISAQEGENILKKSKDMRWYKENCLLEALDKLEMKQSLIKYPFRFPIQDIYAISNKKVIVGTVISGEIKAGDRVVVYPQDTKTGIKSIEVFGRQIKSVDAGQSIGITTLNSSDFKRGQVICDMKNPPQIRKDINAHIFWLSPQNFNIGDCLRIKCATFEEQCKIEEIKEKIDSSSLEITGRNSKDIQETQVGKVVISIDKPMVVEDFNTIQELGRFVLLRDNQVCAGGIVIAQ